MVAPDALVVPRQSAPMIVSDKSRKGRRIFPGPGNFFIAMAGLIYR
jgi:hypothetical protein